MNFRIAFTLTLVLTTLTTARAQSFAGGEFGPAIAAAEKLPADARSPILAQIAGAQAAAGATSSAADTISTIPSPTIRQEAVAGQGGQSFADFSSLIELIQTTVVPDTWDLLGGPSTMREYTQGVYVDAAGTVKVCEVDADDDAVANLKASLLPASSETTSNNGWRAPSNLRCISLQRLTRELNRRQFSGVPVSESMAYLAGLSEVQYVFLDKASGDIVIAGPVGGIETVGGVPRDRKSTRGVMRLDMLMTCLSSVTSGTPFGCTIDPTTEGLQRSAAVAADVQADRLPIGKAAEALVAALGMQRVEVFGMPGDSSIGYLMVEADRHMKELALGIHPMPDGVMNYLDATEAMIASGLPNDLLLRLWFTASPRTARADKERTVFEIAGSPIRLSGENERAMTDGARGNLTADVRTQAFVADFNQNFHAIRTKYPVYGSLEAVYQTASIAELLRRFADDADHQSIITELALQSSSLSSISQTTMLRVPKQIESIAVLHRIRHGNQRHHILIASGGVSVRPETTLASKVTDYPSLTSIKNVPTTKPNVVQNWWWDR